FGVKPNQRAGVFLLQGCTWQRSSQPRRLKEAAYVAYEAGLGGHTEPANDLAATRLEQLVAQLTAALATPAPVVVAPPIPATEPVEDPDFDLPEVRVEQESHLRSFVGREAVLQEVSAWIEGQTEGGYL